MTFNVHIPRQIKGMSKTCIILFGQQMPPNMVAQRVKVTGCQYRKRHWTKPLLEWVASKINNWIGPSVHFVKFYKIWGLATVKWPNICLVVGLAGVALHQTMATRWIQGIFSFHNETMPSPFVAKDVWLKHTDNVFVLAVSTARATLFRFQSASQCIISAGCLCVLLLGSGASGRKRKKRKGSERNNLGRNKLLGDMFWTQ